MTRDDVEQLGHAYEQRRDRAERRACAAFYTPRALAEPLTRFALEPLMTRDVSSLRVCDPAAGGGAFLVQACRVLGERLRDSMSEAEARRLVVRHCLFGIDTDPMAVEVARQSLSELCGGLDATSLRRAVRVGDAMTFPWAERFDAVLCNPPFGNAIRARPAETKATLRVRFAGLRGTADLAYYFLALAESLCRPDAVMAFVLPRAFLNAPAARGLRRDLLTTRAPSLIWCPDGGAWFADANVRVVALALGGRERCVEGENWWARVEAPTGGETVGERFVVQASMTTAMAYDALPFVRDDEGGDGLRFITTGLIDADACRWGATPCRYLKRRFAHPRVGVEAGMSPALAKRVASMRRPKLLVAGVAGPGDRVEAFVDRDGACCGAVSTLTVFDPADDVAQLAALCEQLNGDDTAGHLVAERGATAMGAGMLTVGKAFVKGLRL